ncbi:hypothetical protein Aduo_013134 [Ancylostoma duodenale]
MADKFIDNEVEADEGLRIAELQEDQADQPGASGVHPASFRRVMRQIPKEEARAELQAAELDPIATVERELAHEIIDDEVEADEGLRIAELQEDQADQPGASGVHPASFCRVMRQIPKEEARAQSQEAEFDPMDTVERELTDKFIDDEVEADEGLRIAELRMDQPDQPRTSGVQTASFRETMRQIRTGEVTAEVQMAEFDPIAAS